MMSGAMMMMCGFVRCMCVRWWYVDSQVSCVYVPVYDGVQVQYRRRRATARAFVRCTDDVRYDDVYDDGCTMMMMYDDDGVGMYGIRCMSVCRRCTVRVCMSYDG